MGQRIKKRKTTMTTTSRLNEQELDPLSSLPDAILAEILSRLPTKVAVSTSVLSHRWRTLWTQVNSIDIDCRHFRRSSSELYTGLDQFMSRLASLRIRSFCLRLPDPQHVPLCPVIKSWLRLLCDRNVERVRVTTEGSRRSSIAPFTLPHCIFQTPSLAVLDIFTTLDHNLPADAINLPSLKKLHLSVSAAQCGFVSKLTSSCPLLEELYLYQTGSWDFDKGDYSVVMNLSCPSLKTMQLMFSKATATKIVIDAPKLTTFVLFATFLTCSFVKKPIALRAAGIFAISKALVSSLLPVISNVSVLQALTVTLSCLKGLGDEHLIFPNLTDLGLPLSASPGAADSGLNQLLEPPPARLLQHVKRIKLHIRDLEHGKQKLNMAKYMLSNAPALEWLVFYGIAQTQYECSLDDLDEEMSFCKELSGYPRSSPRCQISFNGRYVQLPGGLKVMSDQTFCSILHQLSAKEMMLDDN